VHSQHIVQIDERLDRISDRAEAHDRQLSQIGKYIETHSRQLTEIDGSLVVVACLHADNAEQIKALITAKVGVKRRIGCFPRLGDLKT
jgi:hypothetical protein